MKSWKKPTNEMIDKALRLVKKGTGRRYFFTRLKNPLWINPLVERGCFQSPPKIRYFDDGYVQFPPWPELQYLKNVSRDVPDEVVNLVLGLPKVDNPTVNQEILDIALELRGEHSAKLMPKILQSLELEHQVWTYQYTDLLDHLTKENQIAAALDFSKILVSFKPDPNSKAKQKRRKKNLSDLKTVWATSLEPSPQIGSWEYGEILSKSIRELAEKEPYKVAILLIDTTADMICLRTHQDDLVKNIDFSDELCERLYDNESDHADPENALIYTLTVACEKVYQISPDAVMALDTALRKQQWKVFKRLRHHLYAQFPSEQAKPWIRELILAREDYHRWEHPFEFQQMIRRACEHFGAALLTEDERKHIFDCILNGPSIDRFTQEEFSQYQRRFHRKQLKPFAHVLFGKYETYFQQLETEAEDEISDDDYPPVKTRGGHVLSRSPRSPEDLSKLTDEELLAYINRYEGEEPLYKGNHFIEVNIEGLSVAFQTFFTQQIIPDSKRLKFWMENREKIARPIYVRMMINGMQTDVKEKHFNRLSAWLAFNEWVLSHPDQGLDEDYRLGTQGDESRENPDWYNSREVVGDFIDTCLEKDLDVPVTARGQIARLLEMLCTQFDRHLDSNIFSDNLIDKAINSVRGRALRTLAKFGYWLRRHDSESELPEITAILEKRFAPDTEHSLTLPEYAVLGRDYPFFFSLNESWATERRPNFFPQAKLPAWQAAFSSFLRHDPCERTFEPFRNDFNFALQYLNDLKKKHGSSPKKMDITGRPIKQNNPGAILIHSLGPHLLRYYLWGMYPLKRSSGHDDTFTPLELFYQVTADNREHWADLFRYVGDILFNVEQLPNDWKDRIIAFFDWRLAEKEPTELQQFTGWLDAECLEAKWRLDAYSKVLDVWQTSDTSIATQVGVLRQLVQIHTANVIECFAKLTDASRNANIFIRTEDAKIILNAGLASDDQKVQQNAVRARDNLLRVGRFDLLDLDD